MQIDHNVSISLRINRSSNLILLVPLILTWLGVETLQKGVLHPKKIDKYWIVLFRKK